MFRTLVFCYYLIVFNYVVYTLYTVYIYIYVLYTVYSIYDSYYYFNRGWGCWWTDICQFWVSNYGMD